MKQSQIEKLIEKIGLSNVRGGLPNAYECVITDTIQLSSEIQKERLENKNLRDMYFFVGDGYVCNVEEGKPFLYWTNLKLNPILKPKNIAESLSQIRINQNGFYNVRGSDMGAIKRAVKRNDGSAVRVDISKLGLHLWDTPSFFCSYFPINRSKIRLLNDEQMILTKAIYAEQEDVLKKIMLEINKEEERVFEETKIGVPKPEFVMKHAKNNAIAFFTIIDPFWYGKVSFSPCSYVSLIDKPEFHVRAVKRLARTHYLDVAH